MFPSHFINDIPNIKFTYHENDGTYIPQPGDATVWSCQLDKRDEEGNIIGTRCTYGLTSARHVEIVIRSYEEGDYLWIESIGGNTNGGVGRNFSKVYSLDDRHTPYKNPGDTNKKVKGFLTFGVSI